jgi:phosphoglycerate dehydrogenase-like enzyme
MTVPVPVPVYLSFPPHPDVDRLRRALGDDADAVEIVAGPFYLDQDAARTRKRSLTFGDGDDAVDAAELTADGRLEGEPELTPEHLDAYRRAEVVVGVDVPYRLPELAPTLRWIQACGAGVGQFGEAGLAARGVVLTSAQGVGAPPIAEFVIGRLLELYKRFRELDVLQREHRWEFTAGETLAGKTMVIVGLGAIGREVAVRARPFGVRVVGVRRSYTPGLTSPDVDGLCGPDQLDDVLAEADIVVVAAPESAETRGMFDAARFARFRPGTVLCNVARGSLIDQPALLDALVAGQVRAAILDVVEPEPLPPDSPLWDAEGVILSPHSSTSRDGYDARLLDLLATNLRRYLHGEPLLNDVDLTAMARP